MFACAAATVLIHFLKQWGTMTAGVEGKPAAEQTAVVAVFDFPWVLKNA